MYLEKLNDAVKLIASDDKSPVLIEIIRHIGGGEFPDHLNDPSLVPVNMGLLTLIMKISEVDGSWPDDIVDSLIDGELYIELSKYLVGLVFVNNLDKLYNINQNWDKYKSLVEFEITTEE